MSQSLLLSQLVTRNLSNWSGSPGKDFTFDSKRFSNYDGDGNENVKKRRFAKQNNNVVRALRYFPHSFSYLARLRHENVLFHTLWRT